MKSRSLDPSKSGLIAALDLTSWTGAQGEVIRITTRGNSNELNIRIQIRDLLGVVIEQESAEREGAANTWSYVTTHPAATDEILMLHATASWGQQSSSAMDAWIPPHRRFTTQFNPAPSSQAPGLSRFRSN